MNQIKKRLDEIVEAKATLKGLNEHADPLQIARLYKDHENAAEIALICALFAYGRATQIVSFLNSLDFSLLKASEAEIKKALKDHKYRYQSTEDVAQIFITFKRLIASAKLSDLIAQFSALPKCSLFNEPLPLSVMVIWQLINHLYSLNPYRSNGYEFYFARANHTCALKRYAMWLRWMARKDEIDLGLINFPTNELLLPLDTHTHKMSLKLGFSASKQANLRTALEATRALKKLDANDPLKYDFALYRISQLGE